MHPSGGGPGKGVVTTGGSIGASDDLARIVDPVSPSPSSTKRADILDSAIGPYYRVVSCSGGVRNGITDYGTCVINPLGVVVTVDAPAERRQSLHPGGG